MTSTSRRPWGSRTWGRAAALGSVLGALVLALVALVAVGGASGQTTPAVPVPLRGEAIARSTFPNPHAHIPAQCFVETSGGTQNACASCHTDGVARLGLGNNNPQAGANPNIGNLQETYAFGVNDYPQVVNSSINPWMNTLRPEVLRAEVARLGVSPQDWDMQAYVRQDNWTAAFAQRPGSAKDWDTRTQSPFRLFPGLSPDDLPAGPDGFVRTRDASRAVFSDDTGGQTGWRAVNFMPYGIFTPLSGSVSGIYLRLPVRFMQDAPGHFDAATYAANLQLVADNVQDRLRGQRAYAGAASGVGIVRGQYPLGTEFAHPLHYVDVEADGHDPAVSPFPGTRARRVKEIRWMYKLREWHPDEFGQALKEESAPVYGSRTQGWIENGTGWLLGGWIEDAQGELRPQTPSELTQCVGCHSGNVRQSDVGQNAVFTSGTGNTVDSTWALPRQLPGRAGWREMDSLGYAATPGAGAGKTPGTLSTPEPVNRLLGQGDFRAFLDRVVGVSLYGDMPASVDAFLAGQITRQRGYSADWPQLRPVVAANDAPGLRAAQETRLTLIREFTARGAYRTATGSVRPELLLPTRQDAMDTARRYRQVVVTQRYDFGKDVFPDTPFTLRYYRLPGEAFTHQNGRAYAVGEIVTDRPVDTVPSHLTYGIGVTPTLIDAERPTGAGGTFLRDYVPLLR